MQGYIYVYAQNKLKHVLNWLITVYLQTSHKIIKTVTSVKLKSSDEKNKFDHYSWIHSLGFVNNFDMSYFNQVLCAYDKKNDYVS